MDPSEWGKIFWWEFHWLANKVDTIIVSMRARGEQDNSDTKLQTELLRLFVTYVRHVGEELLPCMTCQSSTKVFLKVLPPAQVLKDFQRTKIPMASAWIFQLHNLVNVKLKTTQLSVRDFAKHQRQPAFQALPVKQVLGFVESAIRYCMPKWPRRKKTFEETFSKFLSPLLFALHTYAPYANISSKQLTDLETFGRRYATFRIP
jgi:hypothetical protein